VTFRNLYVTLNDHELLSASIAGCQRRVLGLSKDRPQLHGADLRANFWQIDIMGTLTEYALAKATNQHWEPATNERLSSLPGDVGRLQVRSTCYKSGKLIVYPADRDDAPFVFAVLREPEIKFCGWLYGGEAKQVGERRDGATGAEFWVPQCDLRSVQELLPVVESPSVVLRPRTYTYDGAGRRVADSDVSLRTLLPG
jgi:hypothetical protein